MNFKFIFHIFIASLLLSGCMSRDLGSLTLASTKQINFEDLKNSELDNKKVIGTDKVHIVIIFPTGFPDVENAVDDAINRTPGAIALSDVKIKLKSWYIPYIYGQNYYEVEGTALLENKANKDNFISKATNK